MQLSKDLFSGRWGIEREVLRVDVEGALALTPHPFPPDHPQITVDYAEAQAELITGVHDTPGGALEELQVLQEQLESRLGDELLWPFSLPAAWQRGQDVAVAQFQGAPTWEDQRAYRRALEARHGGARQVLSGIHVNYSFGPQNPARDYFALARNFLRYQPVLTYLLAGSPWLNRDYQGDLSSLRPSAAVAAATRCGPWTSSVRQGGLGYALSPAVEAAVDIRYDSLDEYLTKLGAAMSGRDGEAPLLSHPREFYAPVRPKGRDLANEGVEYLEFRAFDLDPLAPLGIRKQTLLFLELFLIACGALTSPRLSARDLARSRARSRTLAQCSLGTQPGAPAPVRALWSTLAPVLEELAILGGDEHRHALAAFQAQIDGSTARGIERVIAQWPPSGALAWGLERARLHRAWSQLELSTRLVIEEADARGLGVGLLDATENFLVLEKGGRREYIKQATRTSADPYVAALVMESKEVTKRVLRAAGLKVPSGQIFSELARAQAAISSFAGSKSVVKPNATNFGDGVTILESGAPLEAWNAALELAFSLDSQVLVERFAAGLEFRFLVIGGRTTAILHRVPAHVVGDGLSTIRQLVHRKNQHPWRGEGYRKPLEKLRLDEVELAFLDLQGLRPESVPAPGQQVFLRKNSNISTGGDSIDFTDRMPPRYARIAERAVAAVGAQICGLDMILPDWTNGGPHGDYTILELNFNPALHIHAFPAEGINRRPEAAVLDLLRWDGPATELLADPCYHYPHEHVPLHAGLAAGDGLAPLRPPVWLHPAAAGGG